MWAAEKLDAAKTIFVATSIAFGPIPHLLAAEVQTQTSAGGLGP